MNTTRRGSRDDPDQATQNILVLGGDHLGFAVAKYLTESAQSVTFVSENRLANIADEVNLIHRKLSDASDIRTLVSEITDIDLVVVVGSDAESLLLGHLIRREVDACDIVACISNPANDLAFTGIGVDHINVPRLLSEQVRDRYE
jgi:Trk K+ transport system NAD-binding subunit